MNDNDDEMNMITNNACLWGTDHPH